MLRGLLAAESTVWWGRWGECHMNHSQSDIEQRAGRQSWWIRSLERIWITIETHSTYRTGFDECLFARGPSVVVSTVVANYRNIVNTCSWSKRWGHRDKTLGAFNSFISIQFALYWISSHLTVIPFLGNSRHVNASIIIHRAFYLYAICVFHIPVKK